MNVTPFPQASGWHFALHREPWIYPVLRPRYWFGRRAEDGEAVNEWFFAKDAEQRALGVLWFTINVRHWEVGSWIAVLAGSMAFWSSPAFGLPLAVVGALLAWLGYPFASWVGEGNRRAYAGWKPYGIGGIGHDWYDAWLPTRYAPQARFRAADGTHGMVAVCLSATLRGLR